MGKNSKNKFSFILKEEEVKWRLNLSASRQSAAGEEGKCESELGD